MIRTYTRPRTSKTPSLVECKCSNHYSDANTFIEVYQPQNETGRYPENIFGKYKKFKNEEGRAYYQKGRKFAIWCVPQSGDHFGVETTGYWWLGIRSEMGQVGFLNQKSCKNLWLLSRQKV